MKKGQVTHICCLITGDRFYLLSDPKKIVWEVRFHSSINIRGQFKKYSVCRTDSDERSRFDANRMVVFLRRTKPICNKVAEDNYMYRFFIY